MRYQAIYTPDAGTGIDMHIAVKTFNTIMILLVWQPIGWISYKKSTL